jgi:hypothetical protein
VRKTGVTILLLLHALIQLGTIALYYADPVIHAICYDFLRSHSGNKDIKQDAGKCVLRMDLAAFKKAKRDEREICWNGEFYDIRKMQLNGNNVYLLAEKDCWENSWMTIAKNILRHITNAPMPGSHPDARFCQWLFKLYVPAQNMPSMAVFPSIIQDNLYMCYNLPVLFTDRPFQPPDILS